MKRVFFLIILLITATGCVIRNTSDDKNDVDVLITQKRESVLESNEKCDAEQKYQWLIDKYKFCVDVLEDKIISIGNLDYRFIRFTYNTLYGDHDAYVITELNGDQILKEDNIKEWKFANFRSISDGGNNHALFVEKHNLFEDGGPERKYYVFGFENGKLKDLTIKKGFLYPEEYLSDDEKSGGCVLSEAFEFIPNDDSVEEDYAVSCPTSTANDHQPLIDKIKKITIKQKFIDGKFVPEVKTSVTYVNQTKAELKNGDLIIERGGISEILMTDVESRLKNLHAKDTRVLESFGVVHVFDTDATSEIFFSGSGGCTGCAGLLPEYLHREKAGANTEYNWMTDESLGNLPAEMASFSPSNRYLAKPSYKDALDFYDFATKKRQSHHVGSICEYEMGGPTDYPLYWRSNEEVVINICENGFAIPKVVKIDE